MAPQGSRPKTVSIIELECDFSDGKRQYWPTEGSYDARPEDDYYHKSLASQWIDSMKETKENTTYTLSALPSGYAIYTKARKSSAHVDRYLFGHPRGKFDSPIKFFVHFKYLMSGGKAECDCVNCKPNKIYTSQRPAGKKLSGRKSLGSPADAMDKTKNPAQKYIDLLYRGHDIKLQHLPLDFDYGDPIGWNCRVFNPYVRYESSHHERHSFEPRENEIVLFYEEKFAVRLEESTQYLQLFDETTQHFGGWPKWKAGRVVYSPEPGQIHMEDLAFSTLKGKPRASLYVCIEVLPSDSHINSSPRTLNVEISHIRPFSMLRELQHGLDQNLWEDNIMSSARLMSNLFLVEPCAFIRLFPRSDTVETASEHLHVKFRCRGIRLGAENIIEGDAVRLMSSDSTEMIDKVLVVKEISYVYEHLEAVLPTAGVFLEGRCVTLTPPSLNSKPVVFSDSTYEDLALQGLPKCMRGFTWYIAENHDSNNRFRPDSILGRCYEREAMELMIYGSDLNIGQDGVHELRQWAMTKQNRNKLEWTWAEHHHGTEKCVRLNDLVVGKRRALELEGNPSDANRMSGVNHPNNNKIPSGRDDGSHEIGTGALEKIPTLSPSVALDEVEDEADVFVREALKGTFADNGDEGHLAKRLRI